jgi:hypothetical protein
MEPILVTGNIRDTRAGGMVCYLTDLIGNKTGFITLMQGGYYKTFGIKYKKTYKLYPYIEMREFDIDNYRTCRIISLVSLLENNCKYKLKNRFNIEARDAIVPDDFNSRITNFKICLNLIKDNMPSEVKYIAFPYGLGLPGDGEWPIYHSAIADFASNISIPVFIVIYSPNEPDTYKSYLDSINKE